MTSSLRSNVNFFEGRRASHMRKVILGLFALCMTLGVLGTSASAQTLHLIAVTDSGDESIGTDVAIDAINVFHLAKGAAEKSGMSFKPQVLASAKIPNGAYKSGGPRNPNLKGVTKSKKVSATIGYDKAKVEKHLKTLKSARMMLSGFTMPDMALDGQTKRQSGPLLTLVVGHPLMLMVQPFVRSPKSLYSLRKSSPL